MALIEEAPRPGITREQYLDPENRGEYALDGSV